MQRYYLAAKAVMLRHRTLRTDAGRRVELSYAPVWSNQETGLQVRVTF